MTSRAVVTGCGVVSPVGLDVEQFWDSLLAGRSGIAPITGFDASDLPTRIAGEVHGFTADARIPPQVSRRMDPFAQYALVAAAQAVEQAKLVVDDTLAPRVAVVLGTGYGAGKLLQTAGRTLAERGPRAVGAYLSVTGAPDNAAAEIALRFGLRGESSAPATACATGSTSVGEGLRLIRHGYADVVVAGGADDSVTRQDIAAACLAKALSRRNDDPAAACRPFDRQRDGFVMSAGAGVVVLEEAGHAARRGATPLAEVAGYGATTDAYHRTAPHPDGAGAVVAMRQALSDARVDPCEVGYVNAHGTSTALNDSIEARALRTVLGRRAASTPISSTKSVTGHMIGAAGAVELVATIQVLRTGAVPPTINLDDPEDDDLDFVPWQSRDVAVDVAMSNSFGFGGHNAVLVVRRAEP